MPLATGSAAFWICKARVAAKAADDDFTAALTVLDDAEKHQPQVEISLSLGLVAFSGAYSTDHLSPSISVMCCRLHLPLTLTEACLQHFFQISSAGIFWLPFSFVALQ